MYYIPAGCIAITRDECQIDPELWSLEQFREWRAFESPQSLCLNTHSQPLPQNLQSLLLQARKLDPYVLLLKRSWVGLEIKVHEDLDRATIRVYLLPDDVLRSTVDRSDAGLRKLRQNILHQLNYSKEAWRGQTIPECADSPCLYEATQGDDLEESMSLLHLFNNIPSPRPAPDSVSDPYSNAAMYDLLRSQVPGLKSELFPYQRRSAALMLQKEVQPASVLDPRLLHVKDQAGRGWYIDHAAGTVLEEPRYYDGVSGGILAEEMGTGKTIICLALILATRALPTQPPEHFRAGDVPSRKRLAPLVEMAASCATRNAVPWRLYFDNVKAQRGEEHERCIDALERNPGHYFLPSATPRRTGRRPSQQVEPPEKLLYLSNGSMVVVPDDLLSQWKEEIHKHTEGLKVLVMTKDNQLPPVKDLLKFDLILFSQTCFEATVRKKDGLGESQLAQVHFKRCIVDEGHKLGNSRISNRSNMLLGLESLHFSSRWIMTGTPSHGLYGVDAQKTRDGGSSGHQEDIEMLDTPQHAGQPNAEMERMDLERIGSIATLYLKARPWANTILDVGDTVANWKTYLMLPKHKSTSRGRWACLKQTFNSLIIRHQIAEVSEHLPPVDEKVVLLEGSYQDQMSLNIFSMMIIFNSVQSQRTDMDYFFHPKQRKSLLQIAHNLKQACFFGGSFFTKEEIAKSVQTAEEFLQEKRVPISAEDQQLLEEAIKIGHIAVEDRLRIMGNQFHEMPVHVTGFPPEFANSWSLDGETLDGMCSSAAMLLALQRLISKSANKPEELNSLFNGRLIQEGIHQRERMLLEQSNSNSPDNRVQTLAGNTKLGDDKPRDVRSHGANSVKHKDVAAVDGALGPLEAAKITATVSSKLSYLINSIIRHQEDEKMIIFYENDNVAWYLASMLELLQIKHLIYAKGLTTKRRAQYVTTFHHNPELRVLLMDITRAAFGLDMFAASRIYFINPVLNPQVEAQAIGRVRRASQQRPVSVETLVLKNSVEEVILERKQHMTQGEHRQVKSILDVVPIYDWIKKASVIPLPENKMSKEGQMAPLHSPQYVFGRGFGRALHPDDGLVLDDSPTRRKFTVVELPNSREGEGTNGLKRAHGAGQGKESCDKRDLAARPARRVRFTVEAGEE
ncbi:hypothetical protein FZEAL_51 [Fusarium zealandicum]|uniref:Helicase C-terminal domain-containing protein n=1 Tax=Fusarium zealandicum TaxID=1053134 RepID=A0A8H4XQP3_9HYPO|nr:hypothetical protein FZEAL_51 [Fusarium zealandicum]